MDMGVADADLDHEEHVDPVRVTAQSTWKKSHANIVDACVRRNCRRLRSVSRIGAGGIRSRLSTRRIVEAPTRRPSLSCSPGSADNPSADSVWRDARSARRRRRRWEGGRCGGGRSTSSRRGGDAIAGSLPASRVDVRELPRAGTGTAMRQQPDRPSPGVASDPSDAAPRPHDAAPVARRPSTPMIAPATPTTRRSG
jgi:hypothetical protein